jgi:hypothetical protein
MFLKESIYSAEKRKELIEKGIHLLEKSTFQKGCNEVRAKSTFGKSGAKSIFERLRQTIVFEGISYLSNYNY